MYAFYQSVAGKLMSFIPGQILLILEIVFGVILLVDTICCVTTVLQIKHTYKTHSCRLCAGSYREFRECADEEGAAQNGKGVSEY